MKIKYIYQNNNNKIEYIFENNKITAKYNNKTDTFDFSNMPNGEAKNITSELDICPVLKSIQENDILYVELLKMYSDDEAEFIESK